MFFRRLQLSQNDGLSARRGATSGPRCMLGTTGLTLLRSRKFTTLEVKEQQPTVACSVRRRGSMAFCSGSSQPGTRLIIARVVARILRRQTPPRPSCLAHSHAARLLCSRPWRCRTTNCGACQSLRCNMQPSTGAA